jgi:hypothetical protein
MHAKIITGKTSLSFISNADLKKLKENMITEWHFEKCIGQRGIIPVKGKFDPTNPLHYGSRK